MKADAAPIQGAETASGNGRGGQMIRLAETGRAPINLFVNGCLVDALAGDTLLTAILTTAPILRQSEFGDGPRAGFCLMGACQDCWVWTESGARLRACSTPAEANMRIVTTEPEGLWPRHA